MTSVRACGCTYRDTGSMPLPIDVYDRLKTAARFLLTAQPMRWSTLCSALGAHTYETRDELHRILHTIGTPEVTPLSGRGRKGTLWSLNG